MLCCCLLLHAGDHDVDGIDDDTDDDDAITDVIDGDTMDKIQCA